MDRTDALLKQLLEDHDADDLVWRIRRLNGSENPPKKRSPGRPPGHVKAIDLVIAAMARVSAKTPSQGLSEILAHCWDADKDRWDDTRAAWMRPALRSDYKTTRKRILRAADKSRIVILFEEHWTPSAGIGALLSVALEAMMVVPGCSVTVDGNMAPIIAD